MTSVSEFIKTAIQLSLALLALGKLPAATQWLKNELIHAQPQMMSIGKFNRMLMNGGRHASHR